MYKVRSRPVPYIIVPFSSSQTGSKNLELPTFTKVMVSTLFTVSSVTLTTIPFVLRKLLIVNRSTSDEGNIYKRPHAYFSLY